MTRCLTAACAALALSLAGPALAGKPHDHGVARLDVGVEATRLSLALEIPLDSLVGFEREPRTDAERQQLDAALARLRDGATLFRIDPAARCVASPADVQTRFAGGHADVDAQYDFSCADAARAAFVEVQLFDAFARLKRVDVQTATRKGQMKARLQRGSSRVPLAR